MLHRKIFLPDPWATDWNFDSFPKVRRIQLIASKHLNTELVQLLRSYSIEIMLAELFYSTPGMVSVIHSDTFALDISKINWIYQSTPSSMNWYKPLVSKDIQSDQGHSFIPYTPAEVVLLESYPLEGPELIQAAVPHNVVNGDGDRWALSIMLRDLITKKQIGFEETTNRLQSFL